MTGKEQEDRDERKPDLGIRIAVDPQALERILAPIREVQDAMAKSQAVRSFVEAQKALANSPAAQGFVEAQKALANSPAVRGFVEVSRFVDRITPPVFAVPEAKIMGQLAHVLTGSSTLLAFREAALGTAHVRRAAEQWAGISAALVGSAGRLQEISRSLEGVAASLARAVPMPVLQTEFFEVARGWRQLTESLPFKFADVARADRVEAGGWSARGLTEAISVLNRPRLELRPEWQRAPDALRGKLIVRLGQTDPSLVERLEGAWERARDGGHDAVSQAANSLVELLNWYLRISATDEDVLGWHRQHGRPAGELWKDKPTRGLRIRYLLRDRDPDGRVADTFVSCALEIHRLLEGIKHKPQAHELAALHRLIPTVEALLIFVVM